MAAREEATARAEVNETLHAIAVGNESQPVPADELQAQIGSVFYLVKDEEVSALMAEDEDMRVLIPAISNLVRTSRMDKRGILEAKIRWRMACRSQIMLKKRPDLASIAKLQAFIIFGNAAFEDTRDGWRGKLFTERVKAYKIENPPQKRRFLGIL